jgi:iron complex transport system ATP-binding protein
MKVDVKEATFAYNTKDIFQGLSFSVLDDDVFYILGPNGCGKTTLLKCLSGMLKLKRGEILLDGKSTVYIKRDEMATMLGYIPQEHSPTFPFTVRQIVLMGRAPYLNAFSSPSKKDVLIAEEAIERIDISYLKDKRYTEISGGEKQLVLMARVLAQQPKTMLLDEPTSHLDFKNQTVILRMIKKLSEEGLSIIMTSHFPNHAFSFSSRVAIMNRGTFLAVGSPEEVITEERLRDTYDIDVRIFSAVDPTCGDDVRFCVPVKDPRDILASGLAGLENVFEGQSRVNGDLAIVELGSGTSIEASTHKEGKVTVCLPSNEILLSLNPLKSSGRNVFKGYINSIIKQGPNVIKVVVEAGQRFEVLITESSRTDLTLEEGTEVYIIFKATAVQVF